MNKEDYRKIMEEYDFIQNSVKSFCKKYGCSESFVFKCLKEWNIPRVTKKRNVFTPRNRLGQYSLKPLPDVTLHDTDGTNKSSSHSNKSKEHHHEVITTKQTSMQLNENNKIKNETKIKSKNNPPNLKNDLDPYELWK